MPLSPRRRAQWTTLKDWIQVGVWCYAGWQVFDNWPDVNDRLHHLTTTGYLVMLAIGLGAAAWGRLETRLDAIELKLDGVEASVGGEHQVAIIL